MSVMLLQGKMNLYIYIYIYYYYCYYLAGCTTFPHLAAPI